MGRDRARGLQVHAFASQGFLLTTANSFEFSEAGLTLSATLTEKLSLIHERLR